MSEYWKSNAKKYCEYCKVWITDNKPSISIHESGKTHKDNVSKRLDEIKKNSTKKSGEEKKYNDSLAAIERAAKQAMEKDVEANPSMKKQYGDSIKSLNSPSSSPQSTATTENKKQPSSKPKPESASAKLDEDSLKRKAASNEPEAKIGKWQKFEAPKPDLSIKKPIDLQLPTKSSAFGTKNLSLNVEDISAPLPQKSEKEEQPKWKPVSSFVQVDTAESTDESAATKSTSNDIKSEPIVERESEENNLTAASAVVSYNKSEQIDPDLANVKQEKVVSLGHEEKSKKSSNKQVIFKKRKNEHNIRERLEEDA